jgi:hypothetical protein
MLASGSTVGSTNLFMVSKLGVYEVIDVLWSHWARHSYTWTDEHIPLV